MVRKLGILLIIFFVVFVANIFLASVIYAKSEKEIRIAIILDELEEIEFDDTDTKYAEFFNDVTIKDKRVAVLKAFLRQHDSPLYDQADFIVKVSDQYELDYRLLPAIAMQESTACKAIPVNSYNCWGWGIYGTTVTRFASYQEGIDTVAKGLKTNYIDRGLKTPEEIMRKYTPSSNGSWALGVNTFVDVLE